MSAQPNPKAFPLANAQLTNQVCLYKSPSQSDRVADG